MQKSLSWVFSLVVAPEDALQPLKLELYICPVQREEVISSHQRSPVWRCWPLETPEDASWVTASHHTA